MGLKKNATVLVENVKVPTKVYENESDLLNFILKNKLLGLEYLYDEKSLNIKEKGTGIFYEYKKIDTRGNIKNIFNCRKLLVELHKDTLIVKISDVTSVVEEGFIFSKNFERNKIKNLIIVGGTNISSADSYSNTIRNIVSCFNNIIQCDLSGLTNKMPISMFGCFKGLKKLRVVKLPKLVYSLLNTFSYCSNLEYVDFSKTVVKSLNITATFRNCSSLQEVDFCNCFKDLHEKVNKDICYSKMGSLFIGCSNLVSVKGLNIPIFDDLCKRALYSYDLNILKYCDNLVYLETNVAILGIACDEIKSEVVLRVTELMYEGKQIGTRIYINSTAFDSSLCLKGTHREEVRLRNGCTITKREIDLKKKFYEIADNKFLEIYDRVKMYL